MATLCAKDVPPEEIEQLRSAIWNLVDDHNIDRDSPLLAALEFILETLTEGRDITIIGEPLPDRIQHDNQTDEPKGSRNE